MLRILLFALLLVPRVSVGQEITMEQTLEYINKKLGGYNTVDVERGVIIARFKDGAEIFREDQVLCKSLDLKTLSYDPDSKIFSISCNSGNKCVDRQLFVKKIQRDYARLSFPVILDAKGVEGMKKAFTHMIRLVNEPKYQSSEPFE